MSEREPILAFLGATAVAAGLFWTARFVPAVDSVLHGAIAVVFLYTPALAARISRRPFDYRAAGLGVQPIGRNLATAGIGIALAWPPFFVGFLLFYGTMCGDGAPALARPLGEVFAPLCPRWLGLGGASLRLPDGFLLSAVSQLLVIALPEEVFFRGYLLGRLEERWPPRRRFWGAPVGTALLVSSALFALGHYLVDFDPQRLAVFFPGLAFGWMRARTGSLAAGALFHALCNLFSDVLFVSFFR